jgi:hypothetical protein
MLIMIPLVIFGIQGMLFLFGIHFARQRTVESLPEVGRRAREGSPVNSFMPTQESRATTNSFSVRDHTSLDGSEQSACAEAGYQPPRELKRVGFKTTTDCPAFPVTGTDVQAREAYAETRFGR